MALSLPALNSHVSMQALHRASAFTAVCPPHVQARLLRRSIALPNNDHSALSGRLAAARLARLAASLTLSAEQHTEVEESEPLQPLIGTVDTIESHVEPWGTRLLKAAAKSTAVLALGLLLVFGRALPASAARSAGRAGGFATSSSARSFSSASRGSSGGGFGGGGGFAGGFGGSGYGSAGSAGGRSYGSSLGRSSRSGGSASFGGGSSYSGVPKGSSSPGGVSSGLSVYSTTIIPPPTYGGSIFGGSSYSSYGGYTSGMSSYSTRANGAAVSSTVDESAMADLMGTVVVMMVIMGFISAAGSTGSATSYGAATGMSQAYSRPAPASPPLALTKVQVGALALGGRELKAELDAIVGASDTSSPGGLHKLLQATVTALQRKPAYSVYGAASQQGVASERDLERSFNTASMEVREKFEQETLVNVRGRRKQSTYTHKAATPGVDELVVVTLLVATKSKLKGLPAGRITTAAQLQEALAALGRVGAHDVMGVEVMWTPQAEGDYYTRDEIINDFPELMPL